MTKLIFMGTPDFSATVLQGLLSHPDYEVVAVVTQPDRAVGRKKTVQMSPVKQLAVAHSLPVYQPQKLAASSELQELLALEVDGIVTAAFGQFLPTVLLDAVGFAVNVHASLLPKYRGGAPIHYALINGDKETGVTIIEMVKEMDAGDMIAAGRLPIEEADTVATLFDKLAVLGRDVLLECLPAYLSGELLPQPQDSSQVSYSPAIRPEKEVLDWSRPATALFNQIRGMYPWPVAHTYWQGERFKIQGACLAAGEGEPGQVLLVSKKELVIACGQGALSLKQVQPAGKPQMPIEAFLNGAGRSIEQGDQFGTEERNS